jgi:hypothetical protein
MLCVRLEKINKQQYTVGIPNKEKFIGTYRKNSLILIDWCLTPTLAVFQLYHGMNK